MRFRKKFCECLKADFRLEVSNYCLNALQYCALRLKTKFVFSVNSMIFISRNLMWRYLEVSHLYVNLQELS